MNSLMIAWGITRSIREFRFLRVYWSQQKILISTNRMFSSTKQRSTELSTFSRLDQESPTGVCCSSWSSKKIRVVSMARVL